MGSKRDPTKSGKPGPQGPSGTLQKSKIKKPECGVNVACGWTASAWNLQSQAVVQGTG